MFFRSHGKAGKCFLHQESRELFTIHFGEHREQVGKSGIGDPHFFAVQDVMLAVRRKMSARPAIQRIGSGRSLGQSVGPNNFSRSQPRQIFFLLLLSPEIHDRQRADSCMSTPSGSEPRILRDVVGDHSSGDFVHLKPAVSFRNLRRTQPQLTRLLQQIASDRKVFVLHLFNIGDDLIDGKLFRRLPDELVLLGEVFWSEDFIALPLFKKETTAGDPSSRNCSRHHFKTPFLTTEATEEHRGIISFAPIFAIYHSLDAITKVCDMEVDEKTYVLAAQLQVRQKLRLVNGIKALSTLQFDDDRLPNHQIETVTEVDGSSIVNDRQHNLIPNLQPLLSQLMDQTGLISALQQPWT